MLQYKYSIVLYVTKIRGLLLEGHRLSQKKEKILEGHRQLTEWFGGRASLIRAIQNKVPVRLILQGIIISKILLHIFSVMVTP